MNELSNIKLPFVKMSGAGNLFSMFLENQFPANTDFHTISKELTATYCNQQGLDDVTTDGLIVICNSPNSDFEMKYFNRDGSSGMMCGNGGRCAVQFACDNGFVANSEDICFINAGVLYRAKLTDKGVKVYFPEPKKFKLKFKLNIMGDMRTCHFADVGTPHAIMFFDEMFFPKQPPISHLQELDIAEWGSALRNHHDFLPNGANANFVELYEDKQGIYLRTYERGVEAETGACGTGAISAAIIASFLKNIPQPVEVTVSSKAKLFVEFEIVESRVKNVSLEGSADYL